jgi:hypothetical protein
MGGISIYGYGNFYWKGKYFRSHRVAWAFANGAIPKGMCVCHKCDIPACTNPDHLFLGTHSDNMKDRAKKGRGADHSGEKSSSAKLKAADLSAIRQSELSCSKLARHYGVVKQTIANIRNGTTWKGF